MKKSIIILIVLSLFSFYAHALDTPKSSKFDDRMQYINYKSNDVTEVKAREGYVTAIKFADDEKVSDIAVGFDQGWDIKDNNNNVYIRPKAVEQNNTVFEPNAKEWNTNLLIVTNKRSYAFDLRLVENGKESNAYFMKFAYPTEEQMKREAEAKAKATAEAKIRTEAKAKAEKKAIEQALDKFTVPRNWDYTMKVGKNSREIAPKFVYDDGVRTYIGFDTVSTIPAVFYYQGEQEMMSNASSKKQGSYTVIVVHKTANRFILRNGDQVVGLLNYGFGKNPTTDVNTTNQNVIRTVKE